MKERFEKMFGIIDDDSSDTEIHYDDYVIQDQKKVRKKRLNMLHNLPAFRKKYKPQEFIRYE